MDPFAIYFYPCRFTCGDVRVNNFTFCLLAAITVPICCSTNFLLDLEKFGVSGTCSSGRLLWQDRSFVPA